MIGRVLVFDTSVLCCLLRIPGKETAGSGANRWDHKRISELIKQHTAEKSTFVLPLASIIETGNHVAQATESKYQLAVSLAKIIGQVAEAESPWAAFTEQADLWGAARLGSLAKNWPELAKSGMSIGDATIKDVADYYSRAGYHVEIITGDAGLKAYEPLSPPRIPRRRG